MTLLEIPVKKLRPDISLPEYSHKGDAGFDLVCVEDCLVEPGGTAILPTGLAFAIPDGYEMQIRARSGMALESPLIIPNAPGTIDSGYRGEIGILVRNLSTEPYKIERGSRIAQAVICPVMRASLKMVETLPDTDRGSGGFGSTGQK